jgi:hypothetical protein
VAVPEGGWRDGDHIAVRVRDDRYWVYVRVHGEWRTVVKAHEGRLKDADVATLLEQGSVTRAIAPRSTEFGWVRVLRTSQYTPGPWHIAADRHRLEAACGAELYGRGQLEQSSHVDVAFDGKVCRRCERADDMFPDAPREDARPEPVVAPLPSEAVNLDAGSEVVSRVQIAIRDFENGYVESRHDVHPTHENLARVAIGALLAAGYRLVPEDDEDTVRVPSIADTCCGKCPGACYVDQVTGA